MFQIRHVLFKLFMQIFKYLIKMILDKNVQNILMLIKKKTIKMQRDNAKKQ